MDPSKLRRSALMAVFWVLVVAGFTFQANKVCNMYFRYQTTIETAIKEPDKMDTPQSTFCIRYNDILNTSRLESDGIPFEWIDQTLTNLTIKNILKYTPHQKETFTNCGFRKSGRQMANHLDRDTCLENFEITKFFTQEYVCYHFRLKTKPTFVLNEICHSTKYALHIYYFDFVNLPHMDLMFVVLSNETPYPLYSRTYGKQVSYHHNKSSVTLSELHIQYQSLEVHLLPPPYDTDCNPNVGYAECNRDCLIAEFANYGKFPSTEMTFDADLDLQPSELEELASQIYGKCGNKCRRRKCSVTTYFTSTITAYATTSVDTFYVGVKAPEVMSIIARHRPQVYFLDFIIYIFSSVGLWFGWSAYSLRPTRWMHRSRKMGVIDRRRRFFMTSGNGS